MSGFTPLEELISKQLEEERARKQSLEQRGLAVITSSGTLVTLLFALAALVTQSERFALEDTSEILLASAAVSFAAAGALGIFIQKPLQYQEPGVHWLRMLTGPAIWNSISEATASRRAAEARVNSIESFRDKNVLKVRLLTGALTLEAIAIGLVVAAVATIFF